MILLRVFIILSLLFIIKCENDLKVCLPQLGCLQGLQMPGYRLENFKAFLGIPYAEPPVGDLRFRNPQPVKPWQGVLPALEAKANCLQKNFLLPNWPSSGSEDCLHLNVYCPSGEIQGLPVIFYIYGGGLFSGSAHPMILGPEYFMDSEQVIVVTVNYRLGPFGFLSTGDSEMPGNFGLKDQFLALKWVNENIEYFGGNPKDITLFGHSAGASSVHYHMINEKAKDLFQRSILSSGNVLAPFVAIQENPLEQTFKIAHEVGIDNPENLSTAELSEILRNIKAETILEAGVSLKFWFNHLLFNYRPVIENPHLPDSYIIEHPEETLRQGHYAIKPWLTGLVSNTGESAVMTLSMYENTTLRAELNANFDEIMCKLMELKDTLSLEEKQNILNKILDEYMQGKHELNDETNQGFQELFSDYYFYYPLYKSLRYYIKNPDIATNPIYIYKFSYHGPYTYVPLYTNGATKIYDVVHFDDLVYQFRQPILFPDFAKDSVDSKLSQDFVDILVQFIKTGKPLHYEKIGVCGKNEFLSNSNSEGICDYLEFVNHEDGYRLVENTKFPTKRMNLWDTFSNE